MVHPPCAMVQMLKGESETAILGITEILRGQRDIKTELAQLNLRTDQATIAAMNATTASNNVDIRFKTIVQILVGLSGIVISVFIWLITRQESTDARADRIAKSAAVSEIQSDSAKWEPRCKYLAQEVLQLDAERRAKEMQTQPLRFAEKSKP